MKPVYLAPLVLATAAAASLLLRTEAALPVSPKFTATDPGPRGGADAGAPLPNLTPGQLALFNAGKDEFTTVQAIPDGLGPRMNLNSCSGCHTQPTTGGTSPRTNPQVAFATLEGATNAIPPFISLYGPVREARFVRNPDGSPDGGVHNLFTIQGRSDAPGCQLAQPNFAAALAADNVIFRIPTPVFGAGLIELIPDSAIIANQVSNAAAKRVLGIHGRPNIVLNGHAISGQPNLNGNDGTAARFGWKAQNKSLLLFAGEAYNQEMGITNELFQTERDETPTCQYIAQPNDTTDSEAQTPIDALSATEKFAFFMRFLAPPKPSSNFPGGAVSIAKGLTLFGAVGCIHCHTPTLRTVPSTVVAALADQPVNLYSDLLLHDMGVGLADGVSQGQAGPREFRSAPLWGLGQRLFFLHDGRTSDLRVAIEQHRSSGSEANTVVLHFDQLAEPDKQHLLNFLRSL